MTENVVDNNKAQCSEHLEYVAITCEREKAETSL